MLKRFALGLAALSVLLVGGFVIWLLVVDDRIRREEMLNDITLAIRRDKADGDMEWFEAVLNSNERVEHALTVLVEFRCGDLELLELAVSRASSVDVEFAEQLLGEAEQSEGCQSDSLAALEGLLVEA